MRPALPLLERYVLREVLYALAATLTVLLFLSCGTLVADLVSEIARGKVPAALLVSQLGLRTVVALPLILPLGLFLGVLLGFGRLYRDSEMGVIIAAGLAGRRLLRTVSWIVLPAVALIAFGSLWMSPYAQRTARSMIDVANRSLLVAGLEPGRFVELPGRHSVVYLAEMTPDGTAFKRLFVHSERDGRVDIVTARTGELFTAGLGEERYLSLRDGFRVEGALDAGDFRMMRFDRNDIRVPGADTSMPGSGETDLSTRALLALDTAEARAELQWRLSAPLSALVLGLLALPLAWQRPRTARYGRIIVAVLVYLVYANALALGRVGLAKSVMPETFGLWWIHALALIVAVVAFALQGRMRRPRRPGAAAGEAAQ